MGSSLLRVFDLGAWICGRNSDLRHFPLIEGVVAEHSTRQPYYLTNGEAFQLINAKRSGGRRITREYEQAPQGGLIKSESVMLDTVLK
jgi:hypothetical protein